MSLLRSGKKISASDEEIISSFRKDGDSYWIGILFERYSHLVFAVSMKYLKNEEDSKDSVLKVFEKLPGDLKQYEIKNFSGWLHAVTKNDCLRVLSLNKKAKYDVERLPTEVEEEDDFLQGYLPHLNEAIISLNEEQRICIQLFYIQKLSYVEVSEKTGFTMNQVKSYIQNGKRNLKIILLKRSDGKR